MRPHDDDHPDLQMLVAFVHARLAGCDAIDVGEAHGDHCPRIAEVLATSARARALAVELLEIPPEVMDDGLYGPTFSQLALQRRVLWIEDQLRDELGISAHPQIVMSADDPHRRRFRPLMPSRWSRR